jgi:glutamine synthetase type III
MIESELEKDDAPGIPALMEKLRQSVDSLEGFIPADMWVLPSYAEMMFIFDSE